MDIHIEALNHPNFDQLENHYRSTLHDRYSSFEFINGLKVKVNKENEETIVKFIIDVEGEPMDFVKATHLSEDRAFRDTMQKLDHVVRKYKTKHYHGI